MSNAMIKLTLIMIPTVSMKEKGKATDIDLSVIYIPMKRKT